MDQKKNNIEIPKDAFLISHNYLIADVAHYLEIITKTGLFNLLLETGFRARSGIWYWCNMNPATINELADLFESKGFQFGRHFICGRDEYFKGVERPGLEYQDRYVSTGVPWLGGAVTSTGNFRWRADYPGHLFDFLY